MKYNSTTH